MSKLQVALRKIVADVASDTEIRNRDESSADLYYTGGEEEEYKVGSWWYDDSEEAGVWHFDVTNHIEGDEGATDWSSDAESLDEAIKDAMETLEGEAGSFLEDWKEQANELLSDELLLDKLNESFEDTDDINVTIDNVGMEYGISEKRLYEIYDNDSQ